MKIFILFILSLSAIWASEITINKEGEVTKIGEFEISVSKVGVLKYDKIEIDKLPSDQLKAFSDYFDNKKYADRKFVLFGKKDVGDYILFVFSEDDVDDGGIEIVYSIKEKKVMGWYTGGYKG